MGFEAVDMMGLCLKSNPLVICTLNYENLCHGMEGQIGFYFFHSSIGSMIEIHNFVIEHWFFPIINRTYEAQVGFTGWVGLQH